METKEFEQAKYPVALQLIIDVMNQAQEEMSSEQYRDFLSSVEDTAYNRKKAVEKVLNKNRKWWQFWVW